MPPSVKRTARSAIADAVVPATDRRKIASRKVVPLPVGGGAPDSVTASAELYVQLAVVGVRSVEVETKFRTPLDRFASYVDETYGGERLSTVVRRDVAGWRDQLPQTPPRGRGLA